MYNLRAAEEEMRRKRGGGGGRGGQDPGGILAKYTGGIVEVAKILERGHPMPSIPKM